MRLYVFKCVSPARLETVAKGNSEMPNLNILNRSERSDGISNRSIVSDI